jgi:hypothetical protein
MARKVYSLAMREHARELRAQGHTIAAVAKTLGISPACVAKWGREVAPPSLPVDWDGWRTSVWSPEVIRNVIAGRML